MSTDFEKKRLMKLLHKASRTRGTSKKPHVKSKKKTIRRKYTDKRGGWDT